MARPRSKKAGNIISYIMILLIQIDYFYGINIYDKGGIGLNP